MPDWKQIVRKKLRVLRACSPEFAEELAGHLEDNYEASLREGVPAEVSFHRTMRQIEGRRKSWLILRFLQEGLMTGFIRKVALPGLLTTAGSRFIYWALELAHIQPRVIWLADSQFLILPLWWWGLLPICGALGALLSQHNGGSRRQRIAAASAPGAIIGALLLLLFPVAFILDGLMNHDWWGSAQWESLGLILFSFAVIPAAFLVVGAGMAEVGRKRLSRLEHVQS